MFFNLRIILSGMKFILNTHFLLSSFFLYAKLLTANLPFSTLYTKKEVLYIKITEKLV